MTEDLVGVHIVLRREGAAVAVTIAQRRSVALSVIGDICAGAPGKKQFWDVVGNPVVVDNAAVLYIQLVPLVSGKPLLDSLAPVAPGVDLKAIVPEALIGQIDGEFALRRDLSRPATAADEDPIEAAMRSNWGKGGPQ